MKSNYCHTEVSFNISVDVIAVESFAAAEFPHIDALKKILVKKLESTLRQEIFNLKRENQYLSVVADVKTI